MRRSGIILFILGVALVLLAAAPVAAAPGDKWFVCKYEGTPGVNERLQTGDNPISVSESAIGVSPVVAGTFFSDAQGRSYVLVQDTGQPEPDPSLCPPPDTGQSPTPSPSPSPSPSASPSPSPSLSPSPSPSTPAAGVQFSVTTCPSDATASTVFTAGMTALEIPDGMSAIRFSVVRGALLISLLNVRIDGVLLTLENTLGDGTVGDRVVTPGTHTWSISNAADTEVLAEGVVDCPVCNAAAVPPPPADVPDTAMPVAQATGLVLGVATALLGLLLLLNTRSARNRR